MGYTKREIITAAFEEIGLASYVFDLESEQIQSALRRLEMMLATWSAKGIEIGYSLSINPDGSELDTDSGITDDAVEAVILNLSMKLAPSYGKSVTMETRFSAKQAYNALLAIAAFPQEMQYPYDMPAGAGNKDSVYLTDPVDQVQSNNGDVLEF
tara:strand:+ start:115 stop:579 length:465 start_codon:yes stop_codon:yes gene_type:complete